MPAFIIAAAAFLGISPLRLIAYATVVVAVVVGAFTIRQHYINAGWNAHAAKIKKQDDSAIAAADKVEQKAAVCTEANGYWDVISQGCKLEDTE